MRKNIFTFITMLIVAFNMKLDAQTVSNFENLSLVQDTFWNGSDFSGGFNSGNAFFPNLYLYDSVYGGYWSSGFAYSNMKDSSTAGFGNMYSARAGSGVQNSDIYAIGQQGSILRLTGAATGKVVNGMYVTNTTYAALSMRDGDAFARKFGDTTGTHSGLAQGAYPDWFLLSITGYFNGSLIPDTVKFYLADYRFADNQQDYIVNDWQWLDLQSLGNVDSLQFNLTSSDNGMFGMNTPPFYCIDNFTTADSPAGINNVKSNQLEIYPNPATDAFNIMIPEGISSAIIIITDILGNIILKENITITGNYRIDSGNFANGTYVCKLICEKEIYTARFVKTIK
jgi:hypothetical protein